MLTYTVDMRGLVELETNMDRAPQTYTQEVTAAINKSLVHYQGTAKTLAPVDTGRLRSSIIVTPATRNGTTIKGSVGTDVYYAIFQEVGTSRGVRPRLYMQQSVDENQAITQRYFEQASQNIAEAIAGGHAR